MPKGMIEVGDQMISFSLKDKSTLSKPFDEILASYCLLVGSDVFANDSTCFLLQFADQLWLVPEETRGAFQLKKMLSDKKLQRPTIVARIDHLPANWRKKSLFLPGIDADLKILTTYELESIKARLHIVEGNLLEEII